MRVQEWMTRPEAETFSITESPRLSRSALSDLRLLFDSFLRGAVAKGGKHVEAEKNGNAGRTVSPQHAVADAGRGQGEDVDAATCQAASGRGGKQ